MFPAVFTFVWKHARMSRLQLAANGLIGQLSDTWSILIFSRDCPVHGLVIPTTVPDPSACGPCAAVFVDGPLPCLPLTASLVWSVPVVWLGHYMACAGLSVSVPSL